VGQRVPEVDEQAIPKILGDMALKAGDHLGARLLIGPHHVAEVFGVETTGQRRRLDEVTEQHGELTAFRLRGRRCGWGNRSLERVGIRRAERLCRLERWCGGRRWRIRTTRPDEDSPIFIHGHLFGVDQVVLEVFQDLVVELPPALEDPIGQALLLLEQCEHLGTDGIVVHQCPSTWPAPPRSGAARRSSP
jgi:hypothetical protein